MLLKIYGYFIEKVLLLTFLIQRWVRPVVVPRRRRIRKRRRTSSSGILETARRVQVNLDLDKERKPVILLGEPLGRLLIFVNPNSGAGVGKRTFEKKVRPKLQAANIDYELILTSMNFMSSLRKLFMKMLSKKAKIFSLQPAQTTLDKS